MNAVYHFKVTDFQGGYISLTARVEVIGETAKSYRIKFLEFGPNGHRPGDITLVRKKAVRLPAFVTTPDNIKYNLPYADN